MITPEDKIVITGGAGLVGLNLITRMKQRGYSRLTVIDKHIANSAILRDLHPDVHVIEADLSQSGGWEETFDDAAAVVIGQAQIGGLHAEEFAANNITATRNVLAVMKARKIGLLVHISSSVVNSMAVDHYTESKKLQESLVVTSGLKYCVLRPTLMFGWFDRKHLGWLSRFMKRMPVFPVPGSGRYLRQPLYILDFCDIIVACLERPPIGQIFDISGQEKIDYVDLIRLVRDASGAGTVLVHIPVWLFRILLQTYALFSKSPPFTAKQLDALITPDEFPVIDWPELFSVPATPLADAIKETFDSPEFSNVVLEF